MAGPAKLLKRITLLTRLTKLFCFFSNSCYLSLKKFYISLAIILSIFLALDIYLGLIFGGPEGGTYDLVMKYRFNSPAPAEQVVIIDIDEKSLAAMAPEYGRWPWARSLFGEVLASLEYEQPKAIIFNILMTDPDTNNKESDLIFQEVTTDLKKTIFPFVRLNQENDAISKVKLSDLKDSSIEDKNDSTVAVLLPFLKPMQESMGISNLLQDDDGSIRKYAFLFEDEKFKYPSLVKKAIDIQNQDLKAPDNFYVNWRNKKGSYKRVSFSDFFNYLQGQNESFNFDFKDKYIVIGSSAPGIANLKATPMNINTDDNFIIANAVDDVLNDSYIRLVPNYINFIVGLITIFLTSLLFIKRADDVNEDIIFGIYQAIVIGVMFLLINYTPIFADFSGAVTFGLIYFAVAKVFATLSDRSLYGAKEHIESLLDENINSFAIIPFNVEKVDKKNKEALFTDLVSSYGVKSCFMNQNNFVENKVSELMNNFGCFLIFSEKSSKIFIKEIDSMLKKYPDYDQSESYTINKKLEFDDLKIDINKKILAALIKVN